MGRDWRCSGVSGGDGALECDERGVITFGDRGVTGTAPSRIDLTKMAHGMDDSKDKAVPCFIAAADLIDDSLKACRMATVHCGHGRSRTGFALIVFLMRHEEFEYAQALKLVLSGMVDRNVRFDPDRKGAEIDKGYQDWVLESVARILNRSNGQALRAERVTSEARKGKNKVIHVILQNKAAVDVEIEVEQAIEPAVEGEHGEGHWKRHRTRRSSMEITIEEGRRWLGGNQ